MSVDRQSFSALDQFLYACGAVAIWMERATPAVLRRRFGLRVFLAGPVMSLIVVPVVGVYFIADPLLSVLAIGGGVALTGFMVYAEMYWLLRNMNEQVLTVEAGTYDLSFTYDRPDSIGDIFDTFETVAGDLGDSISEAKAARERAEREAEKARAAEREAAQREEHLHESVQTMLTAMDRFAEGDLTVRLDRSSDQDDAIHDLFEGFNRAVRSVRQILLDVRTAADETASTTRQISAASDEMAASAEEQSAQSEEVAAAVEELNQTINENAKSVQQTAEAAATGGRRAHQGSEVVAETTEKIEEIADVAQRTAEAIEQLDASSQKIGEVVGTIDEIADQTNLLALNAAIEAARAGDDGTGRTGQGFAVVAEEVRELAGEANRATSEIETMIEEVQEQTAEAVEAAHQNRQRAEEGLALAGETSEALDEIVTAIERVENMTDEIAAASQQQSTTSEEIARSVQSISTAAQESAAGVTQVSDAAATLTELTASLGEGVRQFTLDSSAPEPKAGARPLTSSGGDGHPGTTAEPLPPSED